MKVIGIMGSPRRGGNSDILLDNVLKGAESAGAVTEKIILNDLDFKPCQEDGGCYNTGICVVEDDMMVIYKKFDEADGIVVASPIFFGSVSAQIKMMIDRFNCRWIRKHILKETNVDEKEKKGVFLAVSAADKNDFFQNAKKIVNIFFNTLEIAYFGELFRGGLEDKGAIKMDKKALDDAFSLGKSLAKSLKH